MKVLVTGASGYVGSVVTSMLEASVDGIDVVPVDVGVFAPDIEPLDIFDLDEKAMEGVDFVIHLAGVSNDPTSNAYPTLAYRWNVEATKYLVDLAAKCGVSGFLFASTASVYGNSGWEICREEHSVSPCGVYPLTKLWAEDIVLSRNEVNPVVLRQGTVYGPSPRMRYDLVINNFVYNALKGAPLYVFSKDEWRPFVHVYELAVLYRNIIDNISTFSNKIWNVASFDRRIGVLADEVVSVLESSSQVIKSDKPPKRSYRVSVEPEIFACLMWDWPEIDVWAYRELQNTTINRNADWFGYLSRQGRAFGGV